MYIYTYIIICIYTYCTVQVAAAALALQREIDLLISLPDNKHVVKYLGTERTGERRHVYNTLMHMSVRIFSALMYMYI